MLATLRLQRLALAAGGAIFALACAAGLVHELWTERRLPSVNVEHFAKAAASLERGEYRYAVAQYRLGTEVRRDLTEGFLGLAEAHARSGDVEREMEAYRQLLTVRPRDARAHARLGEHCEKRGDIDGALEHYRLLADEEPDNREARFHVGVLLLNHKRHAEAEEELRRGIAAWDSDPRFHNNLGVARVLQGKAAAAIPCFSRALELDPANANYRANLEAATAEARKAALAERKGAP